MAVKTTVIFSNAFHSKLRKDAVERDVSMGKLIESSMSQGKRPAKKSRLVRDKQTGLLMIDGGPRVTSQDVRLAMEEIP